jgi:hypothetical protein
MMRRGFNRRTSGSRGLLFHRLMQQAVALAPTHRRTVRGGPAAPDSGVSQIEGE